MKRVKKYLLVMVCLCGVFMAKAQIVKDKNAGFTANDADNALFEEGEYWFEFGNYKAALVEYKKLIEKYPDEEILNYRIGVCELNFNDKWENALYHLKKVPYQKYKNTDYLFYLGQAYHHNYMFSEALQEFEVFTKGKKIDKKMLDEAQHYKINCQNGILLLKDSVPVKISNIGEPVNTPYSEYVPLVSSDASIMVYTYRGDRSIGGKQFVKGKKNAKEGEYFEDIMFVEKDSVGKWKEPQLLNTNINTNGNDACVSMTSDGQSLIMFRSVMGDNGTLFETKLDGTDWNDPVPVKGGVNSIAWEGSMSISPDGKVAYFSSERQGGKGGRDIYRATLLPDGTWGNVKNAGDSINTIYDDDAPFFHQSGQYLIICSKGHNSMGGYDIFRCDWLNDSTWTKPKNMGYPINTPGDDIYYCLSPDGKKGYYSSGKAGGFGDQDIYMIEPGLPGVQLRFILLSGLLTIDDQPALAEIEIHDVEDDAHYTKIKTNSKTGKYLTQLTYGNDYSITYKVPGFEPQIRNLSAKEVNEFLESGIDVQFYTEAYLALLKKQKDSLEALAASAKLDLKNEASLVEKYANAKADGLAFRVQIGAFNLPQNFSYSSILKLGKVEKLKLEDKITRFVMGKFDTYAEASAFRDKIIAAGIKDAFVTAIYKDKRTYITELVQLGVFK